MTDRLRLVDTTLRDGMNSVSHQFTPVQVAAIAGGLDAANVDVIEVTHGDGLGGSSIQLGRAAASDPELIAAAAEVVRGASIAALYVPGIATFTDLRNAVSAGATTIRVAVHCTEADCARQAIEQVKGHDLQVMCFLMMSHMIPAQELAEQAALLDSYGADVVYVVDSAGAMVPSLVRERVEAMLQRVSCGVGFHAHNNLGCAIGNSLAAADVGASWLDGSLRGLGAGSGNAQTEVLAAALERAGYETSVDLFALIDVAEEVVAPLQRRPQIVDETALILGYAGVYSTFFLFAKRASERHGVSTRNILMELGRRGIIGGQEDMIVEVAAELAQATAAAG
jgi:4-hydroxy 2-oxovalerate aldolase